jgi:hypothetical protein
MFPLPLVLLAWGQVPTVGVAEVVMGTVMVQLVEAAAICLPVTTTEPVPGVAVTDPPAQVPPTAPVPTTRPAGKVSVKLNVCSGLAAGWVTV